jgi:osmotically-inducible protein OsmY
MTENNRNWGNQSKQDWSQNRSHFNREDEGRGRENDIRYGNTGYGNYHNQNKGMIGNYGNTGFGAYSSDYDSQDKSNDQSNYGHRNEKCGHRGHQNTGSYGHKNLNEEYWNRKQGYGNAGNRGGEEWQRRNIGFRNTGDDYNRNNVRNRYGGDTSNYGNANQGGLDRDWFDKTRDEVASWFGDNEAERRRRRDEQTAGEHRGKGPKNYKRSEDRIREDVCDRLSDDDRIDATNIEVQIQGDEVILTGSVHDREQKRRAEDLVERISGVRNVQNRIRVGSSDA